MNRPIQALRKTSVQLSRRGQYRFLPFEYIRRKSKQFNYLFNYRTAASHEETPLSNSAALCTLFAPAPGNEHGVGEVESGDGDGNVGDDTEEALEVVGLLVA